MEVSPAKLGEDTTTTLTARFSELPTWFRTELGTEVFRSQSLQSSDLIVPRAMSADDTSVVLYFKPLELRTRLLADLVGALPWRAEPGLVVALVRQLATELERTAEWPDPPRFRGSITRRSIFITPDARVRLLGGGPRSRHLILEGAHSDEVLQWAAPEILREGPTARGEVHALAALAYELLSGTTLRPPIGGSELMAVVAEARAPSLASFPSAQGAALTALFSAALSPDPSKRPVSVAAFADELTRALEIGADEQTLRDRLATKLKGLPQNPARAGLSSLVNRTKAAREQGRDPGAALAAWGASLADDPRAAVPRGHSSGIEPIPLTPGSRPPSRPSGPSSLEPEPYRLETKAPTAPERRPSMEDVLKTRRRRRRIRWLAVAFFLLLATAVTHQTLDFPVAKWLHERLAPPPSAAEQTDDGPG